MTAADYRPGALRWARWIVRHAGAVILVVVAVTVAAGSQLVDWRSGALKIGIDPSIEDLLPVGDAQRRYLEHVEAIFGRTEAVVVAVYPDAVFSRENLDAITAIDTQLRALPSVQRVWSLASAPLLAADDESLSMGSVAAQGGDPRSLARAVAGNPLYADTLVSQDGRATALVVYLDPGYEEEPGAAPLVGRIRRIAETAAGGAHVRLAGPPVVKAATGESLVRELSRIVPAIFALIALFLLLAFRSVRAMTLPLLTLGVALVWMLALISVSGRSLNLITAIVPPVVITIGLAYTLHLLSAFYRENHHEDSVERALADVALPLVMTGATTAAGFLALMLSPLAPIRTFAWLCAVGVGVTVALSLTLLPAMLALFGCRELPAPPGTRRFRRFAQRLGRFDVRHRTAILAAGGVLLLLSALATTQIEARTDYMRGFAADSVVRADFNHISEDFGGATPLSVVLESPVPDTFARPDMLAAVADFQDWLMDQPEIGASTSLVDYLKVLNRGLHEGSQDYFAVPDQRSAVKQLLLFGGGDILDGLADGTLRRLHIRVRASTSDSAGIADLVTRIRDRMRTLPAPVTGHVTGSPVLVSSAVDAIAGGQAVTIGAALLVVFVLLSALFTSFRVGALTLLPNLIPVLLYFGTLGIAGIPLNPTTSLIACIVLGIAVDDTLYYFARFNNDARRLASEQKATVSALRNVIRPVTYTSLALVMGFLMLTASGLHNQVQFGALAAFTIAAAWLTDITFTPALASGVRIVTLWDVLRLDLGREPQASIPLFADLKLRQARIFALMSQIQHAAAGERVLSEGDEAGDIFVVLDGELRAWVSREDEEVELSRMTRGSVIGEVGHFAHRRTANVDAMTDARLLRFDSDDLERLRRRYPRIAALVLRNLNRIQAERLSQATQLLR